MSQGIYYFLHPCSLEVTVWIWKCQLALSIHGWLRARPFQFRSQTNIASLCPHQPAELCSDPAHLAAQQEQLDPHSKAEANKLSSTVLHLFLQHKDGQPHTATGTLAAPAAAGSSTARQRQAGLGPGRCRCTPNICATENTLFSYQIANEGVTNFPTLL